MSLYKSFIARAKNRGSRQIVWLMIALALVSSFELTSSQAASLTIASQGKSTYSIVLPEKAAVSVNDAAVEMQRDIAEATGAKLPIVKDNETPNGPFISLGSTKQAQKAGISADKIGYEGFRIATQNNNLFIIGIDTTTEVSQWKGSIPKSVTPHPEVPGPAYTDKGGYSNGTANGVYSFLEEQLGVRWLFPGDLGRVVPSKSTFTIPEVNRTVTPAFNFRILSVIRGGDDWRARQKLGYSANIQYEHSFIRTVPAELWKTHPDWFAMDASGKRPEPSGGWYKLETTNPELVKYFAEKAIAELKANPQMYSYSLSPSDGWGWSQSPESKALFDPATPGSLIPSVTPLVLKFYRDVSAIVAKEYPQGVLGGYLYTVYSYPPEKGGMELPENLVPTIVGKSMGYSFYRPEVREVEARLLKEWAKVAPENWYYYGMPTWMRESSAQITPAAPKELNFLYHNLVDAHIKGAEIYGTYMMSQGALVNYVNAKMLWNPSGDAVAIQHDWLMNAYGPKAGAVMETLYNKMDESWWADFFRSDQSTHYNVSEAMFRSTYGAHYPEMEKLLLEAWSQPMTDKQKARLDLIRQNMIALQFRLRNAGYLPAEYSSPLTQTAKQVFALMTDKKTVDNFSYVLISERGETIRPVKVSLEKPPSPTSEAIPNSKHVTLYSTKDQTVQMTPSDVLQGSSFLSYYVQDDKGRLLTRGFLSNGEVITFEAKANTVYYLSTLFEGIRNHPPITWELHIPGAVGSTAMYLKDTLYLSPQGDGSLYVFAPENLHLQTVDSDAGFVLQTEAEGAAKTRAMQSMQRDARIALENAQKNYQSSVVESLDYKWRFSPDPQKQGDAKGYSKMDFDDSAWKLVDAIGTWQMHGFPDYHGTAWYRKSFTLTNEQTDPLAMGDKQFLLFFGNIDGDAEIYFNGIKIENRVMSEHTMGWEQPLVYNINNMVQAGKNTIAVKVTKDQFGAGLYRGVDILLGKMK